MARQDSRLGVDDMADHAGMSRRNFTRWVLTRRLDEARRLLETTTWSITRIAGACGFSSVVTFRQNFATAFSTTPTSYRRRFAPSGP